MVFKLATCEASPNNALVKYWGKRDERLFLATNGSLSVAMDDQLRTRTTVVFSPDFKEDRMWLEGKKLEEREQKDFEKIVSLVRAKAKTNWHAIAASNNNFPTAAGFASSASGMAALAIASAEALGLKLSTRELSIIARQGSGSACRSVMGGFVEWKKGASKAGIDSFAVQVAPAEHWPEFKCVIAVVEKRKKPVSSRAGMAQTVKTSALFQERLRGMPQKLDDCRKFVFEKDGPKLFELVMREAMSMHACMMDTRPPIIYLNEASKNVIYAVHDYNAASGETACGYTFDAGPNAHVYCLEKDVDAVRKALAGTEGVENTIVSNVGTGPIAVTDPAKRLLNPDGTPTEAFYNRK